MLYKALKPCRFDKFYGVGDIIPGYVIDSGKVNNLINEQGIITPIPGSEDETDQAPTPVEEAPHETPQETEEVPQEKYTKTNLLELKKDNLIEIATGMGLPVDDSMTKAQIADTIILAQG